MHVIETQKCFNSTNSETTVNILVYIFLITFLCIEYYVFYIIDSSDYFSIYVYNVCIFVCMCIYI